MTEQEIRERQQRAYENRDSILPRDVLTMTCTDADDKHAYFRFPSGETLTISQDKASSYTVGKVKITCETQVVKANVYGLFVDYGFAVSDTGDHVTINGPDAQSLVRTVRPVKIQNRDIPPLLEVFSAMQQVMRTEELREWQYGRMLKITASLSDAPGGGGPKGIDSPLSILDDIQKTQIEECREYARFLRRAQKILNSIESRTMRAFVMMKYVMKLSDTEIRQELNLTRRGYERARRAVQDAPCMEAVKWQEKYILG